MTGIISNDSEIDDVHYENANDVSYDNLTKSGRLVLVLFVILRADSHLYTR